VSSEETARAKEPQERFCPECGHATRRTDHFCRNCGSPLDSDDGQRGSPPTSERSDRRNVRSALVGIALVVLAAGVALAVLLATGVLGDASNGPAGPTPAARRAVVREMELRDDFYKAERAYLDAFTAASKDLARYRRQDIEYKATTKRIEEEFADEFDQCLRFAAIPCPEPDYPEAPKAPSFGAETRDMRAASQDFEELRARLTALTPHRLVRALHAQLISATEAVKAEIDHNADVFDEAVDEPGEEIPSAINKGKIKTLRRSTALPAIEQMNRAAIGALRAIRATLRRYDVPGGRDLDSNDHSTAI
jgi:hypothetical protein